MSPPQSYYINAQRPYHVTFHVTSTSHSRHIHVTFMSHPRHIHVTFMSHPRHIHVTFMSHPRHTHVTFMSHSCHTHVTPTSHSCHTHVTPTSRTISLMSNSSLAPPCLYTQSTCKRAGTPCAVWHDGTVAVFARLDFFHFQKLGQ